jgi:hypothetical protein
MYSETDLEDAVAAGALSAEAAAAFRTFVAQGRAASAVDEEHFRLVTGFNDIFVTIASILLLIAVGWIGSLSHPALGGAAVAAAGWGLAEYFTRQRRMALPSILLLLAFVGATFGAMAAMLGTEPLALALSAALAAGAAWLHWQRFRVPITVAAGAAAMVGLVLALLLSAVPGAEDWLIALMFFAGLGVFTWAMRWDISDPERRTRRSDVAFWLHLLAAPLIVHPIFALLGLLSGGADIGKAALVIVLYMGMGAVALAIDRRALLVSALAYVLYAISALFERFGAVNLNFALTALVIGSALLLLSAFWHSARAYVLGSLPEQLRQRLPGAGRPVATPRPAS